MDFLNFNFPMCAGSHYNFLSQMTRSPIYIYLQLCTSKSVSIQLLHSILLTCIYKFVKEPATLVIEV